MTIYINAVSVSQILKWLLLFFEIKNGPLDGGASVIYHLIWNEEIVPAILTPEIENSNFVELWFNSEKLPWKHITELVEQVSIDFDTQVIYEKSDCFYEYFRGQTYPSVEWN